VKKSSIDPVYQSKGLDRVDCTDRLSIRKASDWHTHFCNIPSKSVPYDSDEHVSPPLYVYSLWLYDISINFISSSLTTVDAGPVLSLVSKLLLIDQLPKVLVLHLKRFSLGQFVRKNSKHVDFSPTLNMKNYCSTNCKVCCTYCSW